MTGGFTSILLSFSEYDGFESLTSSLYMTIPCQCSLTKVNAGVQSQGMRVMAPGWDGDRCPGGCTCRSGTPEEGVVDKREMPTLDPAIDVSVFWR